jgi:hypothetical protein
MKTVNSCHRFVVITDHESISGNAADYRPPVEQ